MDAEPRAVEPARRSGSSGARVGWLSGDKRPTETASDAQKKRESERESVDRGPEARRLPTEDSTPLKDLCYLKYKGVGRNGSSQESRQ